MLSGPTYPGVRDLHGDEKRLYARVRQRLWDYEPLRASHAEIAIHVQGRDVELRGRVRTLAQKTLAGLYVERVPEVGRVTNTLVADAEVARSVADVLAADTRTAPYVLQVIVRHGVVTLEGRVPDENTRQAAVEVASNAPLAAAVRERLTVEGPTLPPAAVTQSAPAQSMPAEDGDRTGNAIAAAGQGKP